MKSIPKEEEHPVELLTQCEMELKVLEDWLDNIELEGGYHEIVMPKETYHHELQLEKDGMEPAEELIGVDLLEEVAKQ